MSADRILADPILAMAYKILFEDAFECHADNPWSADKSKRALHPDAVHLRDEEHDGGECEVFECPNCHLVFHVEMPD